MSSDPVRDAINEMVGHWNTKAKQRVSLPPDWHAWMRGLSERIDAVIAAYESQRDAARERER